MTTAHVSVVNPPAFIAAAKKYKCQASREPGSPIVTIDGERANVIGMLMVELGLEESEAADFVK